MKKTALLVSLLALTSFAIAQAPPKAGLCSACHGANGDKPLAPNYPKINNQNYEYLVAALNAYKNGERTGALAGIMAGQAKMLTDEEIKSLSKYYSEKP